MSKFEVIEPVLKLGSTYNEQILFTPQSFSITCDIETENLSNKMCDKRNNFCFVCGLFVDQKHRFELKKNKTVVEAFNLYFNRVYVESRWYEPEYVCSICSATLKMWKCGESDKRKLPFSIPMVWHRQLFHKPEDCYFCQTNIVGYQYKSRDHIQYANVLSASKPVPREEKKKQVVIEKPEESSSDESNKVYGKNRNDKLFVPSKSDTLDRHLVSNNDYHDLVRDLGLSWRQTEILASRLKQWKLVENDFKITFARNKDRTVFEQLFKVDNIDNDLVYCEDIDALFTYLECEHNPKDWRLFLDGSCKSKFNINHMR